ncbi:tyrosine-type recombinase/integrase [Methylophaga thiooxydans]|uniref:tyrosine-type recombinase/integrase n=1 Tax=Methylophaga thiooxydans TaxID=392484 RepID=UPI0023532EDF|nr:site-specific integrase [Methylophaga thiooxydans]
MKKYTGISIRNERIRILIMHDKKRYSHTLKVKPTSAHLKTANRLREEWLLQFSKGEIPEKFQTRRTTLIGALLDDWLDNKSSEVKASTYEDYGKSVLILKREFGQLDANELSLSIVKKFCNTSEASAKRLNNLISPLRQTLQEAVYDEIIEKNILNGWSCKKKRNKPHSSSVDPFNSEEQLAILSELHGQGHNLIKFAFWSGLRTSELIALMWEDIDFENKKATIARALTQAANSFEDTKTISSRREIKLLQPAIEALQAQKEYTYPSGVIFHNPRTDKPWTGDQPIRRTLWIPTLKKANVRYRRAYQTRHTYASMMLSAGEHPMWVASQMGHADWSMIARIYGKWMPEAIPDAGGKAETIFIK